MDVTKIIDLGNASIPTEVNNALAWNSKLVNSEYVPPIEGEIRADGSVAAFISADNKAILFFDDCRRNGKTGKIVNDEVTFIPFGTDLVMVQAKAFVYIDDVLKGTAVAGQVFRIGDTDTMDRVIQYASGLAKSRALTNAGYGVVSSVTIPAPGGVNDPPAPVGQQGEQQLPFRTDNLPTNPAQPQQYGDQPSGTVQPQQYAGQPGMTAPAPQYSAPPGVAPNNVSAFDDPVVRAKAVYWPAKKKTLGDMMLTGDGLQSIIWAAEKMSPNPQTAEIKQAAKVLYHEACRLKGINPKIVA